MLFSQAYPSSLSAPVPSASERWQSSAPALGSVGTESAPLEALPFLPRLGLRRAYSNQFLVGEASAEHSVCHLLEPVAVAGLAGVVPEGLFGQIPEEVDYCASEQRRWLPLVMARTILARPILHERRNI